MSRHGRRYRAPDRGMLAIGRMLAERHAITQRDVECDAMQADIIASLRERRRVLGMSQTELAEACGMSQEQVSLYEGGAREPGLYALMRMCRALGLRVRLERLEDMPGGGAERRG